MNPSPERRAREFDSDAATRLLSERIGRAPEAFLVLGSGLGGLAAEVEGRVEVPFAELPGFPSVGVAGHRGRFVSGVVEGRSVLIQAGRHHFYEGHPPEVVVAPIRIAARLGCRVALLTNAAGGIDRRLSPGSILLVEDHLNLQWRSPLAGPERPGEPRFPDMSAPYDPGLSRLAQRTAAETGIPLHRGTYAGVLGPSYETPAEIRALAAMGASAVGMSTVPEVVAARAGNLRVLVLSLITNPAAGLASGRLSHRDVLRAGERAAGTMAVLVRGILARLGEAVERGSGREPDPSSGPQTGAK